MTLFAMAKCCVRTCLEWKIWNSMVMFLKVCQFFILNNPAANDLWKKFAVQQPLNKLLRFYLLPRKKTDPESLRLRDEGERINEMDSNKKTDKKLDFFSSLTRCRKANFSYLMAKTHSKCLESRVNQTSWHFN